MRGPFTPPTSAASSPPDRVQALDLLRELQATAPFRPSPPGRSPVVLYGAGELGQMAHAWCERCGVAVRAVVDADPTRWSGHPAWRHLPVLAPREVPADWMDTHRVLVCISTLAYGPLEALLRGHGWRDIQPFYDFAARWTPPHPLNNGWHARLPRRDGDAALRGVLDRWDDDLSRAHHLQFLAWRCRRLEWTFDGAPIQPALRYVIAEWMAGWRDGERVLDGGAHHGQTLARWWDLRPDGIAHAWAIEPDADNRAELVRWRDGLPDERRSRVDVGEWALGHRRGRRPFIGGQGYGSRLWSRAGARVAVRPIDTLDGRPSVVKLHLEGHELPALRGAEQTLRTHRPLLAVTVYHQRDGLSATADWLMRTLPRYRWLFRLHGWQGTAAVVYGLPQERSPR